VHPLNKQRGIYFELFSCLTIHISFGYEQFLAELTVAIAYNAFQAIYVQHTAQQSQITLPKVRDVSIFLKPCGFNPQIRREINSLWKQTKYGRTLETCFGKSKYNIGKFTKINQSS
jgi:hypothetical protein